MIMAGWLARIGTTAGRYGPTVRTAKGRPVWTGELVAAPAATWNEPLRRRKPTTWFVNSMGDMFHEKLPEPWLDRAFKIMAATPRHRFLILTKRTARMLAYAEAHGCPPHVWLGTSIEDQERAELRLPLLVRVPAAIRFVSAEPLLEAVDLRPWLPAIQWLIAGAESGPDARPFNPDWARSLRDQCAAAGVPFFFKQDASKAGRKVSLPELDGRRWAQMPA